MAEQRTSWLDRFLDAPPPEMEELPFDAVDLACMIGMAIAWNTAPALGLLVTGVSIAQRIGRRNPATAAQMLALADNNSFVAKLLPGVQAQPSAPTATTRRTTGDLSDLVQQAPLPVMTQPTGAPQKHARNWLKFVNDDIDARPSLAILGPPGSGKTTLMTGILLARVCKGGQVCVISAKPDDAWGGLPYISMDDDLTFTSAERALIAVQQLMLQRYQKRKIERQSGMPNTLEPITIVLDDFAELRLQCSSAVSVALSLARLGRAVRVRLVLMSYSLQVEELGLKGLGESRAFFVTIRTKAAEHADGSVVRTATMEYQGITYDLETAPVVDIARRFTFKPGQWWEPLPKPVEANVSSVSNDNDLLSALLGASNSGADRVTNSDVTPLKTSNRVTSEVTASGSEVTSSYEMQVTPQEAAIIATKLAQGVTPTKIAKSLPGYTPGKFSVYKAKVDQFKAHLAAAANTPLATGDNDDIPPAFKRAMGGN